MIVLLFELLLPAWILKSLLLHLFGLLSLLRRLLLFRSIQFAQILPIFEVSVDELRILADELFEAGLCKFLIAQIVSIYM